MFDKKTIGAALAGAALALSSGAAGAAEVSDDMVKIGVLGDMSGVYATGFSGPGAVAAAEMAVEDFGGEVLGVPIEVISADHQNKADIASATARSWIDQEGVDMITEITNSAAALAVQNVASNKQTITMATGAATTQLTNEQCTKYGIHYGYDTYALPVGTATAIVKNGGESWFFITADYAFGHSLEENTSEVVKALGGEVVGKVRHPLGTNDFSSYLLQAQASGADVIGLANAGQDTVNSIKQANAFGIVERGQQLAGMLVLISDVRSVGLDVAKGLQFTSGWYWDHNEESRQWTERYLEYSDGAAPTFPHAAVYSATTAYLNAVKAAGTDDADAVREQLGKGTIDDFFAQGGHIRPDGVLEHDMYLLRVKGPEQSEGKWDVAEVARVIPGAQAFQPLEEVNCPRLEQ